MSILVSKVATAEISSVGPQEVIITHVDDSIRIGDGTDLVTTTTVSGDVGLDVNVIQSELPDGAATEAKQDSQITLLTDIENNTDGIETTLSSIDTSLNNIEASTAAIDANTNLVESKLDDVNASLNDIEAYLEGVFHPPASTDAVVLTYTDATKENLSIIAFKSGGASGTTLMTITVGYPSSTVETYERS